jgi:hypothetical protein
VAAVGAVAFARRGGLRDFTVAGVVHGTPTPTAQQPATAGSAPPRTAFIATGSWAMSALPGCFVETERVRGGIAELHGKFPPAATRVSPGSVVRFADCTIAVRADDLVIERGADRLRVPPQARLYRSAGRLTLVVIDGTHAEIRRY